MLKTCLLITVYKNRNQRLINWLESQDSYIRNKIDIFLLIQNNDPNKDEYNSLVNHIDLLYCDAKNIAEKRYFGYHWAIDNGYDVLIWSDDDIKPYAYYIDYKTRTKSNKSFKQLSIPIDNLYEKLIELVKSYPDGGLYSASRFGFLGLLCTKEQNKPNVNKNIYPIQLLAINLNNTKDKADYPNDNQECFEDVSFMIDCLVNGLCIYGLPNYSFNAVKYNFNNKLSNVFDDIYKYNRFLINNYVKFGGDLTLSNKGKLVPKMKYSKYYKERKYPLPSWQKFDEELRNICCKGKVTNQTVDEVIEYLKHKNQKEKS